jgi:hypothetical protein
LRTETIVSPMDRVGKTIQLPSQDVPRIDRDPPFEIICSKVAPEFEEQPESEQCPRLSGKVKLAV